MGKWNSYLKYWTVNEPVLVISGIVGSLGILIPLIGVPLRNALHKSEQPQPPDLKDVVSGMTGKKMDT